MHWRSAASCCSAGGWLTCWAWRRILVAGAGVFTAGSLACGLAGSPGVLVTARALEGLGAAMMAPAALSLILAMFPEGAERNKALGAFGAVSGAGSAIGVLAGGMFTTWLSWQWIFLVNIPVGALILAAARALLPESRAELGHRRFDVAGAVTVTGGLSVLVYSVVTQVLGYSAIKAGLAFLVIAVGMIASSAIAQGLVTKAGAKVVLTTGLLGFVVAQVLFSHLPAAGSYTTHLLPGFLLVAAALGLAYVGDFIASATGVSPADAGLASGLINTSQQIGGAVVAAALIRRPR